MIINILTIIFKIMLIIVPLLLFIAYLTYFERKVIGAMQLRKGPNVVGPFGLLQPIADGIKLLTKETIFPDNSSKFLFIFSPVFGFLAIFGFIFFIRQQPKFLSSMLDPDANEFVKCLKIISIIRSTSLDGSLSYFDWIEFIKSDLT